mmetsp:Transcript_33817/g.80275  ORF Transcript_33817/g.80275 Transcript_33817/m.80275 type:complete len:83 (+) Transcript_33817:457-705(+)
MNAGAEAARGGILLFLHADSIAPARLACSSAAACLPPLSRFRECMRPSVPLLPSNESVLAYQASCPLLRITAHAAPPSGFRR